MASPTRALTTKNRREYGSIGDMRRIGTLDKAMSVRSVNSNKSFDTSDVDQPQPRSRLSTLSEIRQRKSSMSTVNRTSHLATQNQNSPFSPNGQRDREKDKERGGQAAAAAESSKPRGGSEAVASARGKVQASQSSETVHTISSVYHYNGLSSMQMEVLRQISLDQAQLPDIHVGSTSCVADLAILERKWSNLAMAQNIRAMKTMLADTPTIVNRADFIFGYTALHWAAKLENGRMVEVLLRYQADPSPVSSNGSTPLHIASRLGHERIIRLLVEAGADCDLRDYCGKQPKDLAAPFLNQPAKDLLYTGLRRSLSVRYGKTLMGHEREVVAHLLPKAEAPKAPTASPERGNLRSRVDKLIFTFNLKRSSSRSHTSTGSLGECGLDQLRTSSGPSSPHTTHTRHSFGGSSSSPLAMQARGDASPLSMPLSASTSPVLYQRRRLSTLNPSDSLPSPASSPSSSRRRESTGERRLPLAWVPAVRKRALEVDFGDSSGSGCNTEAKLSEQRNSLDLQPATSGNSLQTSTALIVAANASIAAAAYHASGSNTPRGSIASANASLSSAGGSPEPASHTRRFSVPEVQTASPVIPRNALIPQTTVTSPERDSEA
eukprot:scpid42252/ scgid32514/ Ankyrin repeat domain-containing protein SOWAHC; Ankyrin repeat domain-containing protein 57; Protein sosondowah homolog C